ncbi:pyridoxal-phosphate dependent enzyme [Nakamurella silvestris]|nr:pyridoxal-phosphate dependent enzyme [Nakamurella silvestris]
MLRSDAPPSAAAPVGLQDVLTARELIRGDVRRTPIWAVTVQSPDGPREVLLKLEQLQVSGTFKARGAFTAVRRMQAGNSRHTGGFIIASGGNAGIAAAVACRSIGAELTVVAPRWAPASKVDRLRALGARVVLDGETHVQTHLVVKELSAASGAVTLHPYDSVDAVAGAGTLALELAEQYPGHGPVVVSVGGGGLIAGVTTVGRAHGFLTVGVEPHGAPTLNRARTAGRPVDVDVDTSAADSLGAQKLGALAFLACGSGPQVESILVSDNDMEAARSYLWEQFRLNVELSAAAALAAVTTGQLAESVAPPVIVLCGANLPGP